jgi:hypothetical protein
MPNNPIIDQLDAKLQILSNGGDNHDQINAAIGRLNAATTLQLSNTINQNTEKIITSNLNLSRSTDKNAKSLNSLTAILVIIGLIGSFPIIALLIKELIKYDRLLYYAIRIIF